MAQETKKKERSPERAWNMRGLAKVSGQYVVGKSVVGYAEREELSDIFCLALPIPMMRSGQWMFVVAKVIVAMMATLATRMVERRKAKPMKRWCQVVEW